MQKLHLWFARRRKNHTHSLRSKWLSHICEVQTNRGQKAPQMPSNYQAESKQATKVKAGTARQIAYPVAASKQRTSAIALQPWSVLGAGQGQTMPIKNSKMHEVRRPEDSSSNSYSNVEKGAKNDLDSRNDNSNVENSMSDKHSQLSNSHGKRGRAESIARNL